MNAVTPIAPVLDLLGSNLQPSDLQPSDLTKPELIAVLDLIVKVGPPIEAGNVQGLSTQGRRRIIPIIGGTFSGVFEGQSLHGRILAAGADFQMLVSETTADLDARYILALDGDYAGEHIFVTNRAVRRANAQDTARLVRGELVDPKQVYFRCVPSFEVSSPQLHWLTQSIFVGTGIREPDCVRLRFYRMA